MHYHVLATHLSEISNVKIKALVKRWMCLFSGGLGTELGTFQSTDQIISVLPNIVTFNQSLANFGT